MTRRMLDSAIWKNEKFGVMPSMARLLAIGIINHADDQGRGKAHPVYLRSQIFPYDDVTATEVADWLAMVADNETIQVYQVDGKDYYQILNWWAYQSHQYAMPSQYPKPDGWLDRIRKTLTKGVIGTCNWITTDGKRSPDTCDEQGLAIQVNIHLNNQVIPSPEDTSISISISKSISVSSNDDDFRGRLIQQWEAVLGMFPTASYPDAVVYMERLKKRDALNWWALAITETVDKAKRPSWQYMKAVLESWLAAGHPTTQGKNGTDPAKKKPQTGLIRSASLDGAEWIYTDIATGQEVRRERRETEELF